jgi:hypothetical protein
MAARFRRAVGRRILGGEDWAKLVLTGSGHSWSSLTSGSATAGEPTSVGALERFRACSARFEGPRSEGVEFATIGVA